VTFLKNTFYISWSSFRLGDSSGISDRGTKAKSLTSCSEADVFCAKA